MNNEHIDILMQQGLILSQQRQWILQIQEHILSKYHVKETARGWDAFSMHLAMMFHRMNIHEVVSECDQTINSQFQKYSKYEDAKKALTAMENIAGKRFPEGEYPYLYLHLCTLLQEVK